MMNPAEFANIARAERDFWWYRGTRLTLFRLVDPLLAKRPRQRALEAGCGTGYFAKAFQEHYNQELFPLDIAPEGLAHARSLGLQRLVQADIAAMPFREGAFDLVLSLDAIVHFPRGDEDGAMRGLTRVLQPGGLLVLRVSALDILRSHHSTFTHERQRFTRARLTALVERHGVRVLRCTYANTLLMPLALVRFRIWEPLFGGRPASGVAPLPAWLDRLLYSALALEAGWLGAGWNFPLGQSLILIGEKQ